MRFDARAPQGDGVVAQSNELIDPGSITMAVSEHVDVLVLGSGQGGKLLAWHLAKAGKKVAVVERRWVGGSCPAVACMPSKNEIWSARVAHVVGHAAPFGTIVDGATTDMRVVRDRKRLMVDREIATHLTAYKESGAELIMGTGRFIGPKTIEVALNDGGSRILSGTEVVINVGTHALVPNVPGLAAASPLTHIEALELDRLPAHLIVLGGGYVGIEMAQAFRRLGSRVTIIEPGHQLMGREDADIAGEMHSILTGEGVDVLYGASPACVAGISGDAVAVKVHIEEGERLIEGSDLLVATGRMANTAGIGLEASGVELNARGFIQVNERLETRVPGTWAIGECAGSPQFTHVSVDDFRIVRDNMAGGNRRTDGRHVPYVMFTEPPFARIGLSEAEAARQAISVRVSKLPMSRVLRTAATDEKQGWMKAVVSADDDQVLGFSMIGAEAGEVLATVQTAMIAELPYTKLRDAVIVHLTYAEGLGPLFAGVPDRKAAALTPEDNKGGPAMTTSTNVGPVFQAH